ncbi:DNA-binding MarR family transcriptional regulator [Sphingopyxis panaciterrae]|uniref:MarR family winged helix-turn-helix transcriptional regulator n=1 Tax=Sphingopyxis panaciterrae TaxID=363841 RepID=UPI001ABB496C|nr:MarR family winged helix-turn-helix transcriptional regulator [Sphingopyxis panaciterrae]NIJ39381.1 DNA-binding MarR family transcriptional regulator [Sphingopyxis panaciterrae]
MMDYQTQTRIDTSAFPAEGFGAWNAGPPETVGGPIPHGVESPLLVVGARADWPDMASLAKVRLVRALLPSQAANYIGETDVLDIVWLVAPDTMEAGVLADICAAAEARCCNLICETSLPMIDRLVAAIPESLSVQFLIDADPTDRLVALAAARRIRQATVHDIARDDAMERIDRLQEEVARISRLLGDLAGQRAALPGTPAGFPPRSDDFSDYPGQVRSPPRDFAAVPRSFVPEERVIERQRAKAVRRMLRQRRMREQYFPADLFADPAWDMLLDLYAARLERQPVSVSSLCIAAAVPATTALRWIKTMTDAGLFLREADPHDGRRIFIGLAEGACEALARYFEALDE